MITWSVLFLGSKKSMFFGNGVAKNIIVLFGKHVGIFLILDKFSNFQKQCRGNVTYVTFR